MSPTRPARTLLALAFLALLLSAVVPRVIGQAATPDDNQGRLIPAQAYTLAHPTFPVGYFGFDATLYLRNLGTGSADVAVDLYQAGVIAKGLTPTIPPGGLAAIGGQDLAGLAAGDYAAVVAASQPVQSLVVVRASAGADRLMAYGGIPFAEASTALYLGPFTRSAAGIASVLLMNIGSSPASATVTFVDGGTALPKAVRDITLDPNRVTSLLSTSIAELPSSFNGYVRVSATASVVGLVGFSGQALRWFRPALAPLSRSFVPRFYHGAADAGGTRTTRLTLVNTGIAVANVDVVLHAADGSVASTKALTVPASGMASFDPADLDPGFAGSAIVSADQPVGVVELTTYDGAPGRLSDADSYIVPGPGFGDSRVDLTYIPLGTAERSVIHAQNAGGQSGDILLTLANGFSALRPSVPPAGVGRFDTSSVGVTGAYSGQGVLSGVGGQPLVALVDLEGAVAPDPTPTPTPLPTPTPPPTSATVTPTLYINYLAGAPGSAFLVRGYFFPAGATVTITLNGVTLTSVTADNAGGFAIVLTTSAGTQAGYYVVGATAGGATAGGALAATAQGAQGSATDLVTFQLVTAGPGAIVHAPPAEAGGASVPVPPSVQPFAAPPGAWLPLLRR